MKIIEIFETMEYSPAPENPALALDWLKEHKSKFGLFINGKWCKAKSGKVFSTDNPASGKQGFEAGAHRGRLSHSGDRHVGPMALLEQARGRLPIDVIASGAVTSGAGIAACLALGAVAVQIGTAFLVSDESGASEEWKKWVLSSADNETVITKSLTGRGARGVRNELVERLEEVVDGIPDYPIMNSYTTALRAKAKERADPNYQSLWAGQGGQACQTGPAEDIFKRFITELDATIVSMKN